MAVQHSTTWASQAVVKKKYGYFSSSLNLLIQNLGHKLLGHWKWHPGPSMEIFFKRHFWSLTASNDKIKARCWIWLTFHRFLGKYPWIYHHTFWELYFLCFKKREKPQSRRCLSMKFKSKKQNKTKKQKNQNFLWTHWAVTTLKIPTSNWLYWIIADNPYIYFSYNDHYYKKIIINNDNFHSFKKWKN